MRDRLLTGWNFQRAFYFIAGGGMVVVSLMDQQWVGTVLGTWFAAMGIFGFGCARNCDEGNCKCDHKA